MTKPGFFLNVFLVMGNSLHLHGSEVEIPRSEWIYHSPVKKPFPKPNYRYKNKNKSFLS